MASIVKKVLVYGASGALGRAVVKAFNAAKVEVFGVDFVANPEAAHNYTILGKGLEEDLKGLVTQFSSQGQSFDGLVCVAGGWAGGSLKSETSELLKSFDQMMNMNLNSALASAHLASKFVKAGGLVVFTGANAARSGTSGMIAYGITKAATHQLAQSLASQVADDGSTVVTVLPVTLDTPSNRQGMPGADFSTWTPCEELANKYVQWLDGTDKPANGSMLLVETSQNVSSWTPVKTQY